jgi:hypothetical protein
MVVFPVCVCVMIMMSYHCAYHTEFTEDDVGALKHVEVLPIHTIVLTYTYIFFSCWSQIINYTRYAVHKSTYFIT